MPQMVVNPPTCIVVRIMLAVTSTKIGVRVPQYLISAMALMILSILVSISKHWCLEYLVQEILSLKVVIASGGDYKI